MKRATYQLDKAASFDEAARRGRIYVVPWNIGLDESGNAYLLHRSLYSLGSGGTTTVPIWRNEDKFYTDKEEFVTALDDHYATGGTPSIVNGQSATPLYFE